MAYIVTGATGSLHVTSDDDATMNRGIVGWDDYCFEASSLTATYAGSAITLPKMGVCIQGNYCRVEGSESVSVDNGTTGMYRKDLVCGTYNKTSSGVESFSVEVVKGTPASTASAAADPTVTKGDIRTGALKRQVPLFRVVLYGSNIQSITRVIPLVDSLYKHQQAYNSLVSTVNTVSSNASTAKSQATTNKSDISAIKSMINFANTLNKVVTFVGTLRAKSQYAFASMSSWVSQFGTDGNPSLLACKIAVQNASGTEQASIRLYGNGRVNIVHGESECYITDGYVQSNSYIFRNPTQEDYTVGKLNGQNVTGKRGVPMSHDISFGVTYTESPRVTATAGTSNPNVCNVGVTNVTTTGFTLWFSRSDASTDTTVYWQASGKIGG